MKGPKKPASGPRRRPGKNTFTTKSGTAIKLNRSLSERLKANREARARRRAAYLSTLPKNRFKRILYRMHPRELTRYWFSRDGAIMALKISGIGLVVCFVLIVGVFAYFRKDLPNIKDLSGQTLGGSVTYYDRAGEHILFQDYNDTKRQPIPGDQISENIKNATVAIEDKDFYNHGAFDVRGIVRAGVNNLLNRDGGIQGGSTISQQLVKLDRQWTAERTLGNKIKEVILAVEMEREYSKDDILTGYLNAAPYGPVSVGVQVAAQDYFGVDAKDLTVPQAAMLAAIPKAPSLYSPYGPRYEPAELLARQRYIIDQMADQRIITKEEAEKAKEVDVLAQVSPQKPSLYTGIRAPYFVLAAKDELKTKYGDKTIQRGGWKVITTVDLKLQELAEKSVAEGMKQVVRQGGDTAAFVAIDNATGQVVSLVGGADFNNQEHGYLNFAHSVRVSPGSTFKPYDYATLIENNNAGAGSVMYDIQQPLPGYPCTNKSRGGNCLDNYDHRYPGPLTLRYALGGSRNVPAVKSMLSAVPNDTSPGRVASINKTISTAEAMMGNPNGYSCYAPGTDVFTATREQETQCYGSAAIGDGAYLHLDDHATGLSTLARLGQHLPRTYILKITDSADKTVDEFKQPTPKEVLKPDTAYILNDMLSDPRASYLSRKFHDYKGWDFAIKTGTTNDSFDGLMGSWSTKYTALTWVGYHTRNKAMTGFMENMTTPIIRTWMEGAHDGLEPKKWERPSGVKTLPAFVVTQHVGVGSREPSPSNDLYPSWYKPPSSDNNSSAIDLVSNKAATECTPELARKTQEGGNHNIFSADPFVGLPGSSSSPDSKDDVHNCNDKLPEPTLTDNCDSVNDCSFTVTVTRGTHPLIDESYTAAPAGTVTLIINGQTVSTKKINDSGADTIVFDEDDFTVSSNNFQVQARVVDSVLYSSNTDQLTATPSGGGGDEPDETGFNNGPGLGRIPFL
jgi:penicillin-binding protein 1A